MRGIGGCIRRRMRRVRRGRSSGGVSGARRADRPARTSARWVVRFVVSVFLILSRVGVRVFERMLLVFVVFLLVDSAVAVFAGVLLPLGCGHRVPFRRVWDQATVLVPGGQASADREFRSRSCLPFVRGRSRANASAQAIPSRTRATCSWSRTALSSSIPGGGSGER